jgi:DNA repair exonuclease SbcCD ATPase subunit
MTDKRLIDLVLDLADNDQTLYEQAKMLVLAALDGEESLRNALEAKPEATTTPSAPPLDEAPEPVGAYLSSIEVAGFRGIGTKATLPLHPGPGLIVVAGRNGSGKSSFAEALELALTGDSYRWRSKDARWSSDWRNIHQPTPCEVRIDLVVDDVGTTTVGLDWADGAALNDRATWTQRVGKRREQGLANLGWDAAIKLYRPILSYEELSGLLQAGPSRLYDALARILGLEQITEAGTLLTKELKRVQEPERQAKELGGQLKDALAGAEDERAASALAQLTKQKPDIDAVTRLTTGTGDQPSGALGQLRALAQIAISSQETIDRTVTTLRQAIGAVADHGDYSVGLAERRTALLEQAVALHTQHGDMACPICGQGALDAGWHDRVARELDRDNAELAKLRASRTELAQVRDAARALVSQVPALTVPKGFDLATLPRAEATRQRWLQIPESDAALAEHLAQGYPTLAEAVAELRAEAATMLAEREDRWTPIALQLATWVGLKKEAQAQADTIQSLKDAELWVKANAAKLRNQQLQPLAARSRKIWAMLRQESNVDLGAITLDGQGTRRHVELRAEVDGQQAGALSVMSQGELHALALALFLPRATAESSPFRFVVLDDPIQAMDPAKVDGFVQVLADIA